MERSYRQRRAKPVWEGVTTGHGVSRTAEGIKAQSELTGDCERVAEMATPRISGVTIWIMDMPEPTKKIYARCEEEWGFIFQATSESEEEMVEDLEQVAQASEDIIRERDMVEATKRVYMRCEEEWGFAFQVISESEEEMVADCGLVQDSDGIIEEGVILLPCRLVTSGLHSVNSVELCSSLFPIIETQAFACVFVFMTSVFNLKMRTVSARFSVYLRWLLHSPFFLFLYAFSVFWSSSVSEST